MRRTLLSVALLAWSLHAAAVDGVPTRDPMHPLAGPPQRAAGPSAPRPPEPPAPVARALLIVGGERYVLDGLRRRAVGDLLDGARIERIDDDAVVVRRGRVEQRLALFASVSKRPSGAAASAPPSPEGGATRRPISVARGSLP